MIGLPPGLPPAGSTFFDPAGAATPNTVNATVTWPSASGS